MCWGIMNELCFKRNKFVALKFIKFAKDLKQSYTYFSFLFQ